MSFTVAPAYHSAGKLWLPLRASMPAMMGEAMLVPPATSQPPTAPKVSKTAAPVAGFATAETSLSARPAQPGIFGCVGELSKAEQPLPVPDHAVSLHPRAPVVAVSVVPPTEVTNGDAAGYMTPKLESPALAVTEVDDALLKRRSFVISVPGSSTPPQLSERAVGVIDSAVAVAVNRSGPRSLLASTRRR